MIDGVAGLIADAGTPSIGAFVLTFAATFAALVIAGLTAYPIYKKRHADQISHETRVSAACDAVLGIKADKSRGIMNDVPGLVAMLPLNVSTKMPGVPTVMDAVNEAKAAAQGAERTARSTAESVTDEMSRHADMDTTRFAELHLRLDDARP